MSPKLALGAGEDNHVSMAHPSLGTYHVWWSWHQEWTCPTDPSAPEQAMWNRRETPPLISQQTLPSITQQLCSRADGCRFVPGQALTRISGVFLISAISPAALLSPLKENKVKSTERASQKSQQLWHPAAKGHAVVAAASPPRPRAAC